MVAKIWGISAILWKLDVAGIHIFTRRWCIVEGLVHATSSIGVVSSIKEVALEAGDQTSWGKGVMLRAKSIALNLVISDCASDPCYNALK